MAKDRTEEHIRGEHKKAKLVKMKLLQDLKLRLDSEMLEKEKI